MRFGLCILGSQIYEATIYFINTHTYVFTPICNVDDFTKYIGKYFYDSIYIYTNRYNIRHTTSSKSLHIYTYTDMHTHTPSLRLHIKFTNFWQISCFLTTRMYMYIYLWPQLSVRPFVWLSACLPVALLLLSIFFMCQKQYSQTASKPSSWFAWCRRHRIHTHTPIYYKCMYLFRYVCKYATHTHICIIGQIVGFIF